jgi:hypothetical protein
MFDGDTGSMPFIGEGNSTTLAWPVTFDPASDKPSRVGPIQVSEIANER